MKRTLLTLLALGTLTLGNAQDVTNGLVAKYSFDNQNINDDVSSLDGHNAGCNFVAGRNYQGSAIHLSGFDDDQIAFIEDEIVSISSDFSVSFWFMADSINPQSFQYMLCSRHDSLGYEQGGLDFIIHKDTKRIVATGRRNSPFGDITTLTSNTVVAAGEWYHVAVTREGFTMKLYVNGTLETSDVIDDAGGEYLTDPYFWSIGSMMNPGGPVITRELWGSVDEIRFYNVGLSASEVATLYNYEVAATVNEYELLNASVYPNPAKNEFTIQLPEGETLLKTKVIDVTGKQVIVSKNLITDISTLPSGTYFIQIETLNNSVTKKLIKN